jgi:hypothetical protein
MLIDECHEPAQRRFPRVGSRAYGKKNSDEGSPSARKDVPNYHESKPDILNCRLEIETENGNDVGPH